MIEMVDKKQKRKTSVEQKKAYTVSTPDTPAKACLHWMWQSDRWKSFEMNAAAICKNNDRLQTQKCTETEMCLRAVPLY